MDKFTSAREGRTGYRWQLLATVSAIALLGSGAGNALAADSDRPLVWIELGGQLSRLSDGQEGFSPPFVSALLENPFTPPATVQAPPRYSIGEEGKISFRPEESDWVFSAGLRYGRANRSGHTHQETSAPSVEFVISIPAASLYSVYHQPPQATRFATTVSQTHNVNTVLDFQIGKDVGLGMLGSLSSSTLEAGVRIAQFTARSSARIDADPDFSVSYKYATNIFGRPANVKLPRQSWDIYTAKMNASRSFKGIGPSLQWDASTTLIGNADTGAVTFDWGLNGAVLFGRQRVRAHHETVEHSRTISHLTSSPLPLAYQHSHNTARSRSVVVPNIGGFAGLSFNYVDAKLSLGYRADFFFGAMDGGIDAAKKENRGFFGPFASISIGLGD